VSLTGPMHAIPGELLTTTELEEDITYNKLWTVPFGWQNVQLWYGDLLLVIASWREWEKTRPNDDGDIYESRKSPALLLHLRCNRILSFEDIEDVGWLWRPSEDMDKLRQEIRKYATS